MTSRISKTRFLATTAILASAALPLHPALADPAVYFTSDLDAGLQSFLDTAAAADAAYETANPGSTQDSLIFQYDLNNITGSRFAVTDTTGTTTVWVETRLGGSLAPNSSTGDEMNEGFTNWSVSYASGDWASVVAAGYQLSFYADSSYTTAYDINAVGLHVSDWGTCCVTGNTTPTGTANASQIYMLFNGSTPLLVGGIDVTGPREEHFVAAIDDRNAFSSVTLVPNGNGEAFGAGSYLVFSTLQIDSVPAGSSVVTVGTGGNIPIEENENATPQTVDDGTYQPIFDGGTLAFNSDYSYATDLSVTGNGGTLDTGSYAVTLTGDLTDEEPESGALTKTGSGTLTLAGATSFSGGWVIDQGTLAGTTATILGDVETNALLLIDQDVDGTFAGNVSGTGSLTKDGDGNVTLTGSNSYLGGTTILGGTLTGDTDALTGNVLNNAALVIDQDVAGTFAGNVSGTGSLTKDGDGNVTLTGSNSYLGGTTILGGTLTGDTDALTGNVLNNAALVIDQDVAGTFAGNVSGTGSLTKDGDGNVTLTGSNSYLGGTTILGGTLTGSTASIKGNVVNNALLVIDQGYNGTFGGAISGTGAFVKSGAGTVTLGGSNTYAGGTVIADGTLRVSTETLPGDVENDGALLFMQNADGTFAGDVWGSGSLTKDGTGNVTLTGTNTYTGGTTILGGTLTGDTDALTGNVLNNAALVIDQDFDAAFEGTLAGSGSVTKTGSGIVGIDGSHFITGTTTIAGGALAITGDYRGSDVIVGSETALYGDGVIGGLLVRTNAELAIGAAPSQPLQPAAVQGGQALAVAPVSIDTMLVVGDALFETGSLYTVDVDAAGNSDLLAVSGALTIEGGTVSVIAAEGDYAWQTVYTIATAASRTGTFSGAEVDNADYDPTLRYTPTSVDLVLTRNDIDFAAAGETANQIAAGTGFTGAFAAGSAEYFAFAGLNGAGAAAVLDSVSGEVHASLANAAWQDSAQMRRAVMERGDLPRGEGPELWLQIQAGRQDWDGDGNAAGYDRDTTAYVGGLEWGFGQSKLGVAIGYSDGDLTVGDRASRAAIKGTHGHLYAGTDVGALRLFAGASYADIDVDTERSAAIAGIDQTLAADYGAKAIGLYGTAGVVLPVGKGAIEPFVGLNWTQFDRDGFAETGGSLALNGADAKDDWTFGSLGMKGHVTLDAADTLAFRFVTEWQHALGGRGTGAALAFDGGPDFAVAGAPLAKDAGLVDVGLHWRAAKGLGIGLSYGGTVAKQGVTQTGRATVSLRF